MNIMLGMARYLLVPIFLLCMVLLLALSHRDRD